MPAAGERVAAIRGVAMAVPGRLVSVTRCVCGLWRYMNASISRRPSRCATSKARSTSAARRLSGFSHSTCFPTSSARTAHSMCSELGSGM